MMAEKIKNMLLKIKDLKTYYPVRKGIFSRTAGYVKAVDGVSLSIREKETLGLVGESGCGKTTLGRTLLRLEKPYSGKALFKGEDLLSAPEKRMRNLRKKIQIIFQDPLLSLNPRMNVLDIVTEGLSEFGLLNGSAKDDAERLMEEVGLPGDSIYRYPHEFSGGQCQRISIARALSVKPEFIVCDEAVSALDVSIQAQVINLLDELQQRYGISYLFISHDLNVVGHISDKIAVMYLGKIVEYGDAGEVTGNPGHPYTKALISAVPSPGGLRSSSGRIILSGEPPSPLDPPKGCPFHPRCPESKPLCSSEKPPEKEKGSGFVACHYYLS